MRTGIAGKTELDVLRGRVCNQRGLVPRTPAKTCETVHGASVRARTIIPCPARAVSFRIVVGTPVVAEYAPSVFALS